MPAPGDQYHGGNVVNPFQERVVNQFTAQEIATLQSRLNQRLGPEFISQRPGNGGGRVAYLEGNKAIALANEVFGFNGWSSSLGQVQIDYVDELQGGKISLGLSIVVRITLKDGTYHEDIGYGSIENGKGKAASFEKAKKEAATDGLKRSLRTFGNVLGNCLYDKDYLKKVQAMKIRPAPFEEDELYRHVHYRPPGQEDQTLIKPEPQMTPVHPNQVLRTRTEHLSESMSADFDDEFDGNLFDGVEITEHEDDEFTFGATSGSGEGTSRAASPSKPAMAPNGASSARPTPVANGGRPRPPNSRTQTAPGRDQGGAQQHQPNQGSAKPPPNGPPNTKAPQTPVQQQNQQRPVRNGGRMPPPTTDNQVASKSSNQRQQNPQQAPQNQPPRPTPPEAQRPAAQARSTPQAQGQAPAPAPQAQTPSAVTPNPVPTTGSNRAPVGFVTSRAAELMQNSDASTPLSNLPAFNPHAESPIPKEQRTPGVEHSRSAPVKWREVGAPPVPGAAAPPRPGGAGFNRPNFVNQNQDVNRRIGMPGAANYAMSPTANRGAYKPPTFANGAPQNALKRPALQDVSNTGANGGAGGADSSDAKRQKVEAPGVENAAVVSN